MVADDFRSITRRASWYVYLKASLNRRPKRRRNIVFGSIVGLSRRDEHKLRGLLFPDNNAFRLFRVSSVNYTRRL